MTILQSLPILSKVLILILGIIMIPFVLALTFPILLTLVFAIPGIFLYLRWFAMMFATDNSEIGDGDMKIPTFYAAEPDKFENGEVVAIVICMPVVCVVFGGIHCAGWFFDFPSSAEAMLWRVSSGVLTSIAFLFPILSMSVFTLFGDSITRTHERWYFTLALLSIFLQLYVMSRLLLLVEAFISLRHLTPGMLALVKWTSFIPHI